MTKGRPAKILIRFLIPLFVGNFFQQIYSLADTMIVGRVLGALALAGVGTSYPVIVLIMSIANGLSMGALVVISEYEGAKDGPNVKRGIFTTLITMLVAGSLFVILGLIFTRPIVTILRAPQNIFEDAVMYLRIWVMSSIFIFLYNGLSAIFNSLARPKVPIVFIVAASLLNIGLDFLFILKFHMRIEAAALASLISMGCASMGLLIYLLVTEKERFGKKSRTPADTGKHLFDKGILRRILKIGGLSAFQQTIVAAGLFIIQMQINSYGSIVIAGYTAASKVDMVSRLFFINLGTAVSTFTAQNDGAGLHDRARRGYWSGVSLSVFISVFLVIVIQLFGGHLVQLFIDRTASPLEHAVGKEYLSVISIFYFFLGLIFVTNGYFRASGQLSILLVSTSTNIAFKVASAFLFSHLMGYKGLWWSNPVGWIAGSCVVLAALLIQHAKEKRAPRTGTLPPSGTVS